MKTIKSIYSVPFPDAELTDAFYFSTVHPDGVFKFEFRYFNDRWNCFVTLPSGEIRAAGVEPNVLSWSGFIDYGVLFLTDLPVIEKSSLYLTSLYIITWE